MIARITLCAIVINLVGCSAVTAINKSANSITSIAQQSKENFEGIRDAVTSSPPRLDEAEERSNQGIQQQAEIIKKSQDILEETSKVKDIVPWWAQLAEIIFVSVGLLGAVVGAWYLGLGALTCRLIGYIPERKTSQANILADALDDNNPTTLREAVAALRGQDPQLDMAFKKQKRKRA